MKVVTDNRISEQFTLCSCRECSITACEDALTEYRVLGSSIHGLILIFLYIKSHKCTFIGHWNRVMQTFYLHQFTTLYMIIWLLIAGVTWLQLSPLSGRKHQVFRQYRSKPGTLGFCVRIDVV